MKVHLNELAIAEKIAKAKPGDCPYTLFLGAGASVSSGIASAAGMVRKWQELLYRTLIKENKITQKELFEEWLKNEYHEWKIKQPDSNQSDYSLLFNYFYQQPKERQLFIEREVEGKKPTFGFLYLAGLIAHKRINRILTTNFDDLLADALVKYYDIKPIVCAFDSGVRGIRVASQRPKIIKLHGDFLYDNLRSMKHELKSLDANMEEKMYEMCKDSGLIVVGYSGGDESVMAPIRDMVRKEDYLNMGLHWCVFNPEEKDVKLPRKVEDIINSNEERVHLYSIGSFDVLMEKIFMACGCAFPKVLTDPHTNNLPKEFMEAVDESGSYLTEHMSVNLNAFIEKAREQIEPIDFYVINAKLKASIAMKARKKSDHLKNIKQEEDAKRELAKAVTFFKESYALVNKFIDNYYEKTVDNKLKIKAVRQKTGLCISLAKLGGKSKMSKFKELLEESLSAVEMGIRLFRSCEKESLPTPIVRTIFYNGCCAHSLLAELDGELTDERKSIVLDYLRDIKMLDPEGRKINDLINDNDFSYFYNTAKMDLANTINIKNS
jgi:NAD-dependent SIR2 family protein deacetylase